jgi:hypothetical protein
MIVKPLVNYPTGIEQIKNTDSLFNPINKFLKGSVTQRFYSSPANGTAISTASIVANTLYAMPFLAEKEITIDSINMFVSTLGTGSNLRFGIYKDSNLYPSSLVLDSGPVASATVGIKTFAANLTLPSALYWLVCVCTATAPIVRGFTAASLNPILGMDNTFTLPGLGYSVNFTFAALPDPFPAGASIRTAIPLPLIALHAS